MSDVLRKLWGEIRLKDRASSEIRRFKKAMDEAREAAFSMKNSLEWLGGTAIARHIIDNAREISNLGAESEKQALRLKHLSGDAYPELKKAIDDAAEASRGLVGESDLSKASNEALKFGASVSLVSQSLGNLQRLSAITGDDLESTMRGVANAVNTGSTRFLRSNAILAKHMKGFKDIGSGMDEFTKKRRELFLTDILKKEDIKLMEQYKEVMDTMSGQTARLKSRWTDIKEIMGEFINKALKPIIATAADILQWFAGTERGIAMVKTITIALIPIIGTLLVAALYSAAAAAWAFIAPLLPFIAIGLAVVAVITAIVLAIEDIYTYMHGGKSVFGTFSKYVHQTFDEFLAYLKSIPRKIIEFFLDLPRRLRQTLSEVKDTLADVFSIGTPEASGGKKPKEKKAGGGSVWAGNSYLVGEKGPEIFTPGRSGAITPNGRFGGMNIGSLIGSLVINVTGPENVGAEIENQVKSALDKIARTTLRAELGMGIV